MMAERGQTFKQVINTLLRAALMPDPHSLDNSFHTYEMGEPVVPLEHVLRVAAELEDEEICRKLSVGR